MTIEKGMEIEVIAEAVGIDALAGLIAGSVVAVTIAAFKLIEHITDKDKEKNGHKRFDLPADVKAAIFDSARHGAVLVKQHAPEGGVERWKWPEGVTDVIRTVAETQRTQSQLMEKWDISLEKHRDREEAVLSDIRDTLRDLLQEIK